MVPLRAASEMPWGVASGSERRGAWSGAAPMCRVFARPCVAEPSVFSEPASADLDGWRYCRLSPGPRRRSPDGCRGLRSSRNRGNQASLAGDAAANAVELRSKATRRARKACGYQSLPHEAEEGGVPRHSQVAGQVACCIEALRDHFDLERVARVVDLGAGRGWLTRALRAALAKPSVGLELDEAQVASARAAVHAEGLSQVSFEVCDLRSPQTLVSLLEPQDLLVALHPCGRLGDLTIEALLSLPPARRPGLFLVSCCLHGRSWSPVPDPRPPLSELGKALGLSLPRLALQRANLWGPGSRAAGSGAAWSRLALRRLLEMLGRPVGGGDASPSLRGLGRGPWRQKAARAADREGLPGPSEEQLKLSAAHAEEALPSARRLELLLPVFGRLAELAVNFDRALALQEAGYEVAVGRAFASGTSPRNCALYAGTPSQEGKERGQEPLDAALKNAHAEISRGHPIEHSALLVVMASDRSRSPVAAKSGGKKHLVTVIPCVYGIDNFWKYGTLSRTFEKHPKFHFITGDAKDVELLRKVSGGPSLSLGLVGA
ncbi:unnamed protein product [Symbiodinium sp. CCMP2592]|nr:unnamed protein product [Symbiodinium sp. CCMP2592]